MTPAQQATLDAELTAAEGTKMFAYDDATGQKIVPGYTLKGNVTIGTGTNVQFLYPEENEWLLHNREQRAITALTAATTWFAGLDPVRQNAIIDLYYNVPAFLKWPHFMSYCNAGNWASAASELLLTHPWIDQVGARGQRIAAALKAGTPVNV